MDRVQLIKRESSALGGDDLDAEPWPAPIAPQEDAVEAAGVYLQDASNRDENVLLSRSGNNMTFTDVANPVINLAHLALLPGRSGGQTLIGGTGAGDDLTLSSTSHATKGSIFLGSTSGYDEVNERLGLGTAAPEGLLHLKSAAPDITFEDTDGGDKFLAGNDGGSFRIRNVTDARTDFSIDGAGDATFAGSIGLSALETVDGRDVSVDGTALDNHVAATNNPHSTDIENLGSGTLAELNSAITDATLDDSSSSRTPTSHASTHQPGGGDAMAVDAAAATGSLRTIGTGALQACAGNDSRLSDARTPTSHASTHNAGGADALAIDAAAATGSLRTLGTGALQACAGNDSRLSDSRTPTSHASSHQHGGGDEIATATPGANAIPKADGSGKLDDWITATVAGTGVDNQVALWNSAGTGIEGSSGLTFDGTTFEVTGNAFINHDVGATSTYSLKVDNSGQYFNFYPNVTASYLNGLNSAGDHFLMFTDGSVNTGRLVIGSWSSVSGGIVIDGSNGNVGIGTASPDTLLEIEHAAADAHHELLKLTENSWSASSGKYKSIVWEDKTGNIAAIGAQYTSGTSRASIDFHSIYNSGYKSESDVVVRINGDGNVGIAETTPTHKLHIKTTGVGGNGIFVQDTETSSISPYVRVRGDRTDGNQSPTFSGRLVLEHFRTDAAIDNSYKGYLGTIVFGANHTSGSASNIAYPASIGAVAEGTFSNVTTMPTALIFRTGSTGVADLTISNVDYGYERVRIDADGNVGIGTTNPTEKLEVFPGTDNSAVIGYAHIGEVGANGFAGFSHVNTDAIGSYALLQKSDGQTFLNTATGMSINFRINNVDKMILDSTGYVGIGTTSPDTQLHLSDASTYPRLRVEFDNSAPSSITQNMPGVELVVGSTFDGWYSGALKFMSTDSDLGGTLPKFTAGVVGVATEGFVGVNDGGMGVAILASHVDPGSGSVPDVVAIFHSQDAASNDQNLELTGALVLGASVAARPAGTIEWDGSNFRGYTGSVWKDFDGVLKTGTPANDQLAVWTSSDTLEGTSALTFNGTDLTAAGDNVTLVLDADQTSGARTANIQLVGDDNATYEQAVGRISFLDDTATEGMIEVVRHSTATVLHRMDFYASLTTGTPPLSIHQATVGIGTGTVSPSDSLHVYDGGVIIEKADSGVTRATNGHLFLENSSSPTGIHLANASGGSNFIKFSTTNSYNGEISYAGGSPGGWTLTTQNNSSALRITDDGRAALNWGGIIPSDAMLYMAPEGSVMPSIHLYSSETLNDQRYAEIRIDSDGMLYLDAGLDGSANNNIFAKLQARSGDGIMVYTQGRIRMGHSSALAPSTGVLYVSESTPGVTNLDTNADELVLYNSANCGMTISSGDSSLSTIAFGDATSDPHGTLIFNNSDYTFKHHYFGSSISTDALTVHGSAGTHAYSTVQVRHQGAYSRVSSSNVMEIIGSSSTGTYGLLHLTNPQSQDTGMEIDTNGDYAYLRFIGGVNYARIAFYASSNQLLFQSTTSTKLSINSSGVGINTTSASQALDVNSDTIRLQSSKTPSSATASGTQGQIAWDSNYIYVCVATNQWRRAAILGGW